MTTIGFVTSNLGRAGQVLSVLGPLTPSWLGDGGRLRRAILHVVNREDLATALERHATDAANEAALALRAGAVFKVWEELQSAHHYLDIYAWRAECMAQDGISTCKDFETGVAESSACGR
ncbi:hypothetical protein ACWGJX_42665 [Streptomyces sp. NPDC054775]